MSNFILYKHTSPSGKVYIGQTNSIKKRWFPSAYKHNTVFYKAILKYGWDNIHHEVLYDDLTKKEVNQLEIKYIRYYKNLGISYNITDGGEGKLGVVPWHKGTKGLMPTPWNKGKHHSQQTKDKISKTKKGVKYGKQSPEHIKHKVEKHKIPILVYCIETGEIRKWPSAIDIERFHPLHFNRKSINACCREKCWSIDDYIFMYETKYSKEYLKFRYAKYLNGLKYRSTSIPENILLDKPNDLIKFLNNE